MTWMRPQELESQPVPGERRCHLHAHSAHRRTDAQNTDERMPFFFSPEFKKLQLVPMVRRTGCTFSLELTWYCLTEHRQQHSVSSTTTTTIANDISQSCVKRKERREKEREREIRSCCLLEGVGTMAAEWHKVIGSLNDGNCACASCKISAQS